MSEQDDQLEAKKAALKRIQDAGLGSQPGEFPEDDELTKTAADKFNDALSDDDRKKKLQDLLNQAK